MAAAARADVQDFQSVTGLSERFLPHRPSSASVLQSSETAVHFLCPNRRVGGGTETSFPGNQSVWTLSFSFHAHCCSVSADPIKIYGPHANSRRSELALFLLFICVNERVCMLVCVCG